MYHISYHPFLILRDSSVFENIVSFIFTDAKKRMRFRILLRIPQKSPILEITWYVTMIGIIFNNIDLLHHERSSPNISANGARPSTSVHIMRIISAAGLTMVSGRSVVISRDNRLVGENYSPPIETFVYTGHES